MKKRFLTLFVLTIFMFNYPVFSQTDNQNEDDTTLLGLPGDNLDLYAVLDLFQESKTIEDFEKSLNEEEVGINNLDLNLDGKVDFIKVETKQNKDDFVFVLQVDVIEKEIQDVAVILVSKDEQGKVSIQIVGDEELYGKDYVIEPKLETPSVTSNPAYSGPDTVVVVNQPATVVVVESAPIVHYVYSPVYVPYYPPYYYGYYPVYYRPYPVISITFYRGNNRHHHNHYRGGHGNRGGNTVVINNNNNYNSYNSSRNKSNTVNRNKTNGNYKSKNSSNTPKAKPTTKPSNKSKAKPTNKHTNPSKAKATTKPSGKQAVKPSTKPAAAPRSKPASKPASKPTKKRR